MGQILLAALLKELETNPDRVFALLERLLDLLAKHPDLLTAILDRFTPPRPPR